MADRFVSLMPIRVRICDERWAAVFGPLLVIHGGTAVRRVSDGEADEVTTEIDDPAYPKIRVGISSDEFAASFNPVGEWTRPLPICNPDQRHESHNCLSCFKRRWQEKAAEVGLA